MNFHLFCRRPNEVLNNSPATPGIESQSFPPCPEQQKSSTPHHQLHKSISAGAEAPYPPHPSQLSLCSTGITPSPHTPHFSQHSSASTRTTCIKQVAVPEIKASGGITESGEVLIQYADGTELSFNPKTKCVKYKQANGREHEYQDTDINKPSLVETKIQHLQLVISKFKQPP